MPNHKHESRQEGQKSIRELTAFQEFAERSHLAIVCVSIEKRKEPEPDILCHVSGEGYVAFELKELCDPKIAKQISYKIKMKSDKAPAVWAADPTEGILRSALDRKYKSDYPMELILYKGSRVVTPADVAISVMRRVLEDASHKFRRVWFMGLPDETCECVFPAPNVLE